MFPAFEFCFYLLLRYECLKYLNESELDDKKINLLFSFARTIMIKLVAMSVGEFENGDANFDANRLSMFFFCFHFFNYNRFYEFNESTCC